MNILATNNQITNRRVNPWKWCFGVFSWRVFCKPIFASRKTISPFLVWSFEGKIFCSPELISKLNGSFRKRFFFVHFNDFTPTEGRRRPSTTTTTGSTTTKISHGPERFWNGLPGTNTVWRLLSSSSHQRRRRRHSFTYNVHIIS